MSSSLHVPRIRPVMQWKEHNLNRLLAFGVVVFWVAVVWLVQR